MRNVNCHGSFYVILKGSNGGFVFLAMIFRIGWEGPRKSKELDPRRRGTGTIHLIRLTFHRVKGDSSFTCRCLGVVTKWCEMKKGTACITTKKLIQQYTSSWGCFITQFHGKLKMIYDILWVCLQIYSLPGPHSVVPYIAQFFPVFFSSHLL